MSAGAKPTLHFRVTPTNVGASVSLSVHLPGAESDFISTRADLVPIAAAIVRYRVDAIRQPQLKSVVVGEGHFAGKRELFRAAWNFLKNAMREVPTVRPGHQLRAFEAWLAAREQRGAKLIEVDAEHLSPRQVTFSVIRRNGNCWEPLTDSHWVKLFDFLVGRCAAEELWAGEGQEPCMLPAFKFGRLSTRTTVMYAFPEGLGCGSIRCRLAEPRYTLPAEVELLIDRAHQVLRADAPEVLRVADQRMLAPRHLDVSVTDLDSGNLDVVLTLADSSYRYYAAFAFAALLAAHSPEFAPLLELARSVPAPRQPAPATCSIGVRVVVETSDARVLVAHRSNRVKLNPDVWSVSANEGVRRALLREGVECSDLLSIAVTRALGNELRLEASEVHGPLLLSIYRNEFNQWGAGFYVRADPSSDQVIKRLGSAKHAFEHRRLAALPLSIEACGRTMRDLGERWYGGALETVCQVLAWRELASGKHTTPEEVAVALSHAAGHAIMPVDEANPTLLPTPRQSLGAAQGDPAV